MGGKVMLKVLVADESSAIYQVFATVAERIADSKTGAKFAFEVGPVKQAGLRDG
jgi:hypothetical protein